MRSILAVAFMAFVAGPPSALGAEAWDGTFKNHAGFILEEKDVGTPGQKPYVNGEWQGNWNFELTNCPRPGCLTFSGQFRNMGQGLTNYVGNYRLPDRPCALRAAIGEDPRTGTDSGFVISLAPLDSGQRGCAGIPPGLTGHYVPTR